MVEVMWIAPNANSQNKIIDDFTTINLKKNLRNTKEIVLETKEIAEAVSYRYKEQLKMPPQSFPKGWHPIYKDSIEKALNKARELTNEGIFVISGVYKNYREYVKGPGDGWIKQDSNTSQLSPYEYLLKGGILVANKGKIHGFEWPTIIVAKRSLANLDFINLDFINLHDCNYCMRCTTNLFIVQ